MTRREAAESVELPLPGTTEAAATRPLSFLGNWRSFVAGIALGLLAMLPLRAPPAEQPGAPFRPVVEFSRSYATLMLTYQRTQDANQPDGAVVFLGDSHTQGLATAAVADRAVNYGVGGLTTKMLLDQVPRLGSLHRARVVVLMIGSNDLPHDADALPERFEALAAAIPGPLVWHAIPGNVRFDPADTNEAIARICAARGDCTFVATDWQQPADYQRDGSHLSASGYAKFISTLADAVSASPPTAVR